MKMKLLKVGVLLVGFALLFASCEQPTSSEIAPKTFTVTFNTDGGSAVKSQTVLSGAQAVKPADPTKYGYTFGGWHKEAACTNLWDFGKDTVAKDITLYAKWNEIPGITYYTVSFNSNEGSLVPSQQVAANAKATRPVNPTRQNYTFDNWYREATLSTVYDFNAAVTASITLYAKWRNPSGGSDTAVTFSSVTANGSSTQSTTQLTLTFSQAITGLSADDISLSGVSGMSKGTLTGSGPVYTLPVSGFTGGGTLSVSVAKAGYAISGSPQTATIYYYSGSGGGGDTAVTLKSVTADGSSSQTTTELIITVVLDKYIADFSLSGDDITLSGVDGVIKGTPTLSGGEGGDNESFWMTYTLPISGFSSSGTLSVSVSKPGYAISGSPKTVSIYGEEGNGEEGIAVAFVSVTANGSETSTTTHLTFTFDKIIEGLSAADITLDATTKGTVKQIGSDPVYTMDIWDFGYSSSLYVKVEKPGYAISNSSQYVDIYYDFAHPNRGSLVELTADGSETRTTEYLW